MFAYCLNNPVVSRDSTGESTLLAALGVMAIGGVIGGIANVVAVASNGGSVGDCAWAALAGFIGGALGTGVSLLMATTPATAPYAAVVGRGVATFVTDLCTSGFVNKEITANDIAYAAVDATMDMTLSTIAYYYNPVSNETAQTITNFVIDGVTDIGQNELYSQNSYTNTASIPTQTVTKKPTMTKSTTIVKSTTITRRSAAARNYAHQKVGRLIGAI